MDIGSVWMMAQSAVGQAANEAAAASSGENIRILAKAFGAAFAIGVGVFAPGLSEGFAAGKAVEGIARNPGANNLIFRTMLVGQAVAESNSIYALVVALLILFLL